MLSAAARLISKQIRARLEHVVESMIRLEHMAESVDRSGCAAQRRKRRDWLGDDQGGCCCRGLNFASVAISCCKLWI
jgi:hypothetical protein